MAGEEKKEIVEKVKQIISEQLGVDENEVTPSASFVDDLGADSLDQVELVGRLAEQFQRLGLVAVVERQLHFLRAQLRRAGHGADQDADLH